VRISRPYLRAPCGIAQVADFWPNWIVEPPTRCGEQLRSRSVSGEVPLRRVLDGAAGFAGREEVPICRRPGALGGHAVPMGDETDDEWLEPDDQMRLLEYQLHPLTVRS
jgi:hypothetical protein